MVWHLVFENGKAYVQYSVNVPLVGEKTIKEEVKFNRLVLDCILKTIIIDNGKITLELEGTPKGECEVATTETILATNFRATLTSLHDVREKLRYSLNAGQIQNLYCWANQLQHPTVH